MPASAVDRMLSRVGEQVTDPRVLRAMTAVPRERFVPETLRDRAYVDGALPIGEGQTISQPAMVGIMSQALRLTGDERVLEIGTGSGYQAAILARLARAVVTVEIIDALRVRATQTLAALGIDNVRVLAASDEIGAPADAPFDAVLVTAAAPAVPRPLLAQLRVAGRLVIPVGSLAEQELLRVTRTTEGIVTERLGRCRFVPLVGPHGFSDAARSSRFGA